jgi:prolyl oligopeptidase PreP (S9A serine peptidase family)
MLSDDGRRAILVAEQGTESEVSVLDLGDAKRPRLDGPLVRLLTDRAAFHTPVDTAGDTLFLRTNLEAPRGRIVSLDLNAGAGAVPRTIVSESQEVIADAVLAGDRLVVHELADARSRLRLFSLEGVLLTGYGGYGANVQPSYQADVPLWLERGGIFAVANLRGGGEYGDAWHRAGMLERKQTTFDDFIAAAEYLIAEGYTVPERLAIYGHSNGGLLVGAAITQRPDLFAAAVANAGHYDMLRYHRFTAGAAWVTE